MKNSVETHIHGRCTNSEEHGWTKSSLIIISSRVTVEVKFAAYSYFAAHLYNLHTADKSQT